MTEPCDKGYQPKEHGFTYECGEIVWKSEAEMHKNLKCYDDAHSKAKCITEAYRKKVEKDLQEYIDGTPSVCKDAKQRIVMCVQENHNIANCFRELQYFRECLDETVRETYECHPQNI